ncbi:MAG: hypothetical protein WCL42_01730 [Chlorobiaceae bacterium]
MVDINATETNSVPVDEGKLKLEVDPKSQALAEAMKALKQATTDKDIKDAKKTVQSAKKKLQDATNKLTNLENGHQIFSISADTNMVVIGQDDEHLMVKLELPKRGYYDDKLNPNVSYSILKKNVDNSGLVRTGATFGALVVPFKYQLSGKRLDWRVIHRILYRLSN